MNTEAVQPATSSLVLKVAAWVSVVGCSLLAGPAFATSFISVTPTTVAFSNQAVGASGSAKTITVKNTASGSTLLNVTSVTLSGSGTSSHAVTNGCKSPVKAGATCAITVTFAPKQIGSFPATLTIKSNGSTSPVTVAISGSNPLRPLPAIYKTAKTVAYSPYRAGGPGAGEVPTSTEILQDLNLMSQAGYTLIRLFGSDPVSTSIISLASTNYPKLSFQLGIYLEGTTNCVDSVNSTEIATAVALAKKYSNIVAVSVGNETQLGNVMPVTCLAGYINTTRAQVTQPVTVDDSTGFFAGQLTYKPDSVLRLIDFVSVHTYPFSEAQYWDWQQDTVVASARTGAMMNAALVQAQNEYSQAYDYLYLGTGGSTVSIGKSLPIIIGETGWKAVATDFGNPIEDVTGPAIANPVNAKYYLDLVGAWRGTSGGPVAVFTFEAFDEPWKGQDNGWGLWTVGRTPRYALCGTPAGSACKSPVYSGAGYYH